MCGRYTVTQPGEVLLELGIPAEQIEALDPPLSPRYNAAPTQRLPVARATKGGEAREAAYLRWGLIPFWAKDAAIGNQMINARAETVAEKSAFRNALKRRRCLIPADGFYEWKKMGTAKQPFHIHLADRAPFAFAGLWERWDKGPEPIESFTILTTRANTKVADLHDRMPVILLGGQRDVWLDPSIEDPADLLPLLEPMDPDLIAFLPVSRVVNNARFDGPECIQPIAL
jgi:putative SOS response-associated peptidase YedK